MSKRPISIIIPNHNHLHTLRACLDSILETTEGKDCELIVVDDGSTDGSVDYLRKIKGVRLIQQVRQGTAAALNAGIRAAGRNDVVRVHADVVVETEGWLDLFQEIIDSRADIGVIGVKIVRPDDNIQAIGRNIITGLGMRDWNANLQTNQLDSPRFQVLQEVDTVSGVFAYYRRETLDAVGGLDEHYAPAWVEDDDFCIAARFNQYKVFVLPTIKAVHYGMIVPEISRAYIFDKEFQSSRIKAIKQEALNHHYDYWEKKWGWNPLYPDLNEIRRLYGKTEICWRIGERMRFQPKESQPHVDACIVTWNNLSTLKSCLEAMAATDYPREKLHFYVVNNGSTDGTRVYLDQLAANFPFSVKVTHLEVNVGAAPGLNVAFAQGNGEMVAKLDDDVFPPPDWINRLLADFQARPFAGVVGGKAIYETKLHDIQCGAVNFWPQYFNHMHEIDQGQANYLARVAHVQGACCLYRRQTLKDCGYLDIRFNPSQWDDVEHHLRLYAMGYEVIYDGKMGFVHKFGFNAAGTGTKAKLSNASANEYKIKGKWSDDVYQIIEFSIDSSREGRYLPDNGDTSHLSLLAPQPGEFPRKLPVTKEDQVNFGTAITLETQELPAILKDQQEFVLDMVAKGMRFIEDRQDGCIEVFQQILYLRPYSAEALVGLAAAYATYGIMDRIDRYLKRAQSMTIKGHEFNSGIVRFRNEHLSLSILESAGRLLSLLKPQIISVSAKIVPSKTPTRFTERPASAPVIATEKKLSVLFLTKFSPDVYRSMNVETLTETVNQLEDFNIHAEISTSPLPKISEFDLVHVWGVSKPEETIRQIKGIRSVSTDIPIVFSPNFINIVEADWVVHQLPLLFFRATSEEHLNQFLDQLKRDELQNGGIKRTQRHELLYAGYERFQRESIELSDYLLPQCQAEAFTLSEMFHLKKPFSIWQHAVDPRLFDTVAPMKFINEFGIKDFILVTEPIGWAQNQGLLLTAIGAAKIPVVFVGKVVDQNDMRLLRRIVGTNVQYFESLPPELMLSAFKAARLHITPGWMGLPVNSLKAALAGTTVVLSDRIYGAEYFENSAYYFDPGDVQSIKSTLIEALKNQVVDGQKRKNLSEHVRQHFSWEVSIRQLLGGYSQALELKHKSLPEELARHAVIAQDVASPSRVSKAETKPFPAAQISAAAAPLRKPVMQPAPQPEPAPSPALVDIVIPIYGQAALLRQCVQSVLATTSGARLILVDDCSPGNEILTFFQELQNHPRIILTHTPTNQGFIGATEHGASLGSAPYILFLNSDTEAIQPGWLEKMIPAEDTVAISGALLLYPPDMPGPLAGSIQHAGVARNPLGVPYHPFLGQPADTPSANQVRDVNAVTGGCLLVRRKVWEEMGGWEKEFGRGVYEDVDLCWRVRQKGYRVVFQPGARLYHRESASRQPGLTHTLYEHLGENRLKLLQKWSPIASDEALFYGEAAAKKWEKAFNRLHKIQKLLDANKPKIALEEAREAVRLAPDYPLSLQIYAQLLARHAQHERAVDTLRKLLKVYPADWDSRMLLVDELIILRRSQEAAQELAQVIPVMPTHPRVMERAAQLSAYLDPPPSRPSEAPPAAAPVIIAPVVSTPAPKTPSAAETLAQLLDADDITQALKQFRDRLDAPLLDLVQQNALSARREGQTELADGLDALAEYIQNQLDLAQRPPVPQPQLVAAPVKAPPAQDRSAKTLELLLNAEDILAALDQYQDRLDAALLALVRQNSTQARADAQDELADGLDNLAEYIQAAIQKPAAIPTAPPPAPIVPENRAAQTLELLLNAEDILAALDQYQNRLDAALLALVQQNANRSRQDGESELADGLETLADYIQQALEKKPPVQPAPPQPETPLSRSIPVQTAATLEMLLNAEDLTAALEQHRSRLDSDLLGLVQQNASRSRQDGEIELAEGLEALAGYIQDVLDASGDSRR